jgi:hypothetical protein
MFFWVLVVANVRAAAPTGLLTNFQNSPAYGVTVRARCKHMAHLSRSTKTLDQFTDLSLDLLH